jgi:hypothetical protein
MLLRGRGNSSGDAVNAVVDFMIEMKSVDYEAVLDMPSTVFDEYTQGLKRRAELEKATIQKTNKAKTFG